MENEERGQRGAEGGAGATGDLGCDAESFARAVLRQVISRTLLAATSKVDFIDSFALDVFVDLVQRCTLSLSLSHLSLALSPLSPLSRSLTSLTSLSRSLTSLSLSHL